MRPAKGVIFRAVTSDAFFPLALLNTGQWDTLLVSIWAMLALHAMGREPTLREPPLRVEPVVTSQMTWDPNDRVGRGLGSDP
jgi:hypothetical protein